MLQAVSCSACVQALLYCAVKDKIVGKATFLYKQHTSSFSYFCQKI